MKAKSKVVDEVKKEEQKKDVVVDLEIEDVPGIGPTKAKQMRENGILTVFDLASVQMDDLAIAINASKETAMSFINEALTLLRKYDFIDKEFTPADDLEIIQKQVKKIDTGSELVNKTLGGGIESRAVTEFYGEYGSGKSQMCLTLCAMVHNPVDKGGMDGGTVFIDTERTFRTSRLREICETRGLDTDKILKGTIVSQVYNAGHLELAVKQIGKYIKKYNAKLVIVDSLTSLHRSDFIARGTLADRQQRLNQIMHKLVRTAAIYDVAVVVTNQVMSKPDQMFGDPITPVGGHVVGHSSTYRLYLKKSGKKRIVTMVDSPKDPYAAESFLITEKGVEDDPENPHLKSNEKEKKK